jgi:ethanolamine-phosphate cytidylyltransferase
MAPNIDPEVGCPIPEPGQWPVDPQEDVEIAERRLWIDGCFDFFHHGIPRDSDYVCDYAED